MNYIALNELNNVTQIVGTKISVMEGEMDLHCLEGAVEGGETMDDATFARLLQEQEEKMLCFADYNKAHTLYTQDQHFQLYNDGMVAEQVGNIAPHQQHDVYYVYCAVFCIPLMLII